MLPISLLLAIALGVPASTAGADDAAWRDIARAPIEGRIDAGVVWTGRRVLVWGGVHRGNTIEAVADGAGYDPARDR